MYRKNAWLKYGKDTKPVMDFAKDYEDFLSFSKTERLAVKEIIKILDKNGFKNIDAVKELTAGEKIYVVNKNKFPNKTKAYIKDLTRRLNENTFKDERFTDVRSNPEEKMDLEDVVGDSVYDNLATVASRNVVRGKFNDAEFLYGEVALGKATTNKKEGPIFVGKYISMPNKLELRGRIIIKSK